MTPSVDYTFWSLISPPFLNINLLLPVGLPTKRKLHTKYLIWLTCHYEKGYMNPTLYWGLCIFAFQEPQFYLFRYWWIFIRTQQVWFGCHYEDTLKDFKWITETQWVNYWAIIENVYERSMRYMKQLTLTVLTLWCIVLQSMFSMLTS